MRKFLPTLAHRFCFGIITFLATGAMFSDDHAGGGILMGAGIVWLFLA